MISRVVPLREGDVRNYDNALYRYTGSVKLGTVKIEQEKNEPYGEYEGLALFFHKILNFFSALVSVIVYEFR